MATAKKIVKKSKPVKEAKVVKPEAKEYDIEARTALVKAIENPIKEVKLTTLQKIQKLSDKRNSLSGRLMGGDRVPNKENIAKEVKSLTKEIAALKIAKVKEDQRGR